MVKRDSVKNILCCVVGMSPAVLTETIWTLAHLETPVIPDEIIALTTVRGRQCIAKLLFSSTDGGECGWGRLVTALAQERIPVKNKLRFGMSHDCIRLFSDSSGTSDLEDIATTDENAAAADFMLKTIREFTENPNTRLYASIAGGRKTMSALMLSCMSLLGREHDHVLHVLVNEPFDKPMSPPFLFPEKHCIHELGGRIYQSSEANLDLIDLPFVKMRGWYQDKFKTLPPSYSELVSGIQKSAPKAAYYPALSFDFNSGVLTADGAHLNLSPAEFLALALLLHSSTFASVGLSLCNYHKSNGTRLDWFCRFTEGSRFASSDDPKTIAQELSKVMSSLRGKLKKHPKLADVADRLCPMRNKLPSYPLSRISADIHKLNALLKT